MGTQRYNAGLKIAVLNCHSLEDKLIDIKKDKYLNFSDIICLSETWLKTDEEKEELKIDGYQLHLNSYGTERGKGLAVYYKNEKFSFSKSVKMSNLQVSSFTTHDLEVVAVYRSANCQNAKDVILPFITQEKNIIICGDFNIC